MKIVEKTLQEEPYQGAGRVRRFETPGGDWSVTQITTFCPNDFGPGPTNLHLIATDKLILLDTGVPTRLIAGLFYSRFGREVPPEVEALPPDLNEDILNRGFELAGFAPADVDLLVISHGHWDHFLMGRHVLSDSGAEVAAHVLDTPLICNPWSSFIMWAAGRPRARSMGMPPLESMNRAPAGEALRQTTGLSLEVDWPIFEAGPLRVPSPVSGVKVAHLPGHSPGGIGLIVGNDGQDQILLPGDVLLDPITPIPMDLLAFLRTLEDMGNLENVALALPAHGHEIIDVKARVAFLQEHHRRRLGHTYQICRQPASIWDVASTDGYFDVKVDPGEFNFLAGAEALVHVGLLGMVGGVRRFEIRDGVHYFEAGDEPFEAVYGRVMDLVRDRTMNPLEGFFT